MILTKIVANKVSEKTPANFRFADITRLTVRDIDKIPLLNRQEEKELAKRIAKGDEQACEELFYRNSRLVRFIVSKHISDSHQNYWDLFQEACLGLMVAVRKFSPEKKTKFSTYASYWIKSRIFKRILKGLGAVVLPQNTRSPAHKVIQYLKHYVEKAEKAGKHNKPPSYSRIAKDTKISKDIIRNIMNLAVNSVSSLDEEHFSGDQSYTLYDKTTSKEYTPEKICFERARNKILKKAVWELTDERHIIALILFYGLFGYQKRSQKKIAEKFGVWPESIRQWRARAIKDIKSKYSKYGKALRELYG